MGLGLSNLDAIWDFREADQSIEDPRAWYIHPWKEKVYQSLFTYLYIPIPNQGFPQTCSLQTFKS